LESCQEKLEDLLNNATPYKTDSSRPRNELLNAATPKAPAKVEMRTSTPVQHSPLASSLKEYSPGVQEKLKKLEMYGDASPLPPLVLAQRRSSLRRGFRPPRRALDTSAAKPASSNAHDGKE